MTKSNIKHLHNGKSGKIKEFYANFNPFALKGRFIMKKTFIKLWIPLLISAILSTVIYILPISGEMGIYDKVIRLHVIANSDSESDQALKLKVRDAVLEVVSKHTNGCKSKSEAETKISACTDEIKETAEKTLKKNGCDLGVTIKLGKEDYPTKNYEDVRLPAGNYTSLRVMIGEAEGQNWWCVLFPPLCRGTAFASEEFISVGFTPNEVKILTDSDSPKYTLKFRIIEIIESLFS